MSWACAWFSKAQKAHKLESKALQGKQKLGWAWNKACIDKNLESRLSVQKRLTLTVIVSHQIGQGSAF